MERNKVFMVAGAILLVLVVALFLLFSGEEPAVEETGFVSAKSSLESSWLSQPLVEEFELKDISYLSLEDLENLRKSLQGQKRLLVSSGAPKQARDLAEIYLANIDSLIAFKEFDESLNLLLYEVNAPAQVCASLSLYEDSSMKETDLVVKNAHLYSLMQSYKESYPSWEEDNDFEYLIALNPESLSSQYSYAGKYLAELRDLCGA